MYEDYSRAARHYDITRQPIGLPILIGCFATVGRPLADLNVLDAGCGTSSYAIELLDWVNHVDGIDASLDMIKQGQEKATALKLSPDRLRLHHAMIDRLPFDDKSFDCVMVNQVLHHLDDVTRHQALGELSRVTRPGGVLVINTCSPGQLHDAWWYRSFFPQAFDRFQQRLIPLLDLIQMLGECHFDHQGSFVPTESLVRGDAYFDFNGPLSQEWRDGDSVFALATEQELADGCSRIRKMRDEGTLRQYALTQDARRASIGQVTFLSFSKKFAARYDE